MKLLHEKVGGVWLALNNGIYLDGSGASRSAIVLLGSWDGVTWHPVCRKPILGPDSGWKRTYVYAFDWAPNRQRILDLLQCP